MSGLPMLHTTDETIGLQMTISMVLDKFIIPNLADLRVFNRLLHANRNVRVGEISKSCSEAEDAEVVLVFEENLSPNLMKFDKLECHMRIIKDIRHHHSGELLLLSGILLLIMVLDE